MRVQNPQLERTPTTLVLRQARFPQRGWLAFGGCWLALLAPAGCVFLPLLLIGSASLLSSGGGLEWRMLVGHWNSGLWLVGFSIAFFVAVGAWMLWMGLRGEYLEAHIWTFDKINRRLMITRQMRNRHTRALRIEQAARYPLPVPGSVQMRSLMGPEHFEHELVVTVGGTTIRGMRQWAIQGDLRKVAREINDFLAA